MTRFETLPEVPALSSLYGRALARQARLMVVRPGALPAALPQVGYRVEDVGVDHDRLSAYQHLLGEPGTDALPAGFVHVLAFPLAVAVMARENFPLPMLGMVHVANRVEQLHRLQAGDTLTMRAWARHLRAHRSGTQVDLVTEVGQVDGIDVAWRGVSTYLAKGKQLPGLALVEAADGGASADPPAPTGPWSGDDLPEATAVWRLGASAGREYARVSGDKNPIHTSRLGAKAFGFKKAIAHGMYTASRALAAVGPARGDAFVWEVEFAKPVLLPGHVSLALSPVEGGTAYLGWDQRSGKRHFTGAVHRLP